MVRNDDDHVVDVSSTRPKRVAARSHSVALSTNLTNASVGHESSSSHSGLSKYSVQVPDVLMRNSELRLSDGDNDALVTVGEADMVLVAEEDADGTIVSETVPVMEIDCVAVIEFELLAVSDTDSLELGLAVIDDERVIVLLGVIEGVMELLAEAPMARSQIHVLSLLHSSTESGSLLK